MVQVIIGLFWAVFGASLILGLVSAIVNFFGKASVWIVFILVMAVYAMLFASANSWMMFFPRLVMESIFSLLSASFVGAMLYFIFHARSSKKFFLGFLAANWAFTALCYIFLS